VDTRPCHDPCKLKVPFCRLPGNINLQVKSVSAESMSYMMNRLLQSAAASASRQRQNDIPPPAVRILDHEVALERALVKGRKAELRRMGGLGVFMRFSEGFIDIDWLGSD